jgi:hypothetical protein
MYIVAYVIMLYYASVISEIATNVFVLLCDIADGLSVCIVVSLRRFHS